MRKIAVYGTLREGCGNWRWALAKEPAEVLQLEGFRLGVSFLPYMEHTGEKEHLSVVEIYDVDDNIYEQIKRMEEGAGYTTTDLSSLTSIVPEGTTVWLKEVPEYAKIVTDYVKEAVHG